ncbi:hypothetical protein [Bradyrhizobium sp. 186]|uniref:hypothetical protein n=1 Tax=Bradyrhizobium sp. 186 TaxID=2782654 RepID=UPI0020010A8C|nr:hypothetical protein [Bradyrhizobium sp. 186]
MRHLIVVGICLLLAGCGLAARQEREQQQAAAAAAMQQGFESCKVQFPEGTKNMVEKNKCNATAALAIRPFTTYPDLFRQVLGDPSRHC